MGTAVAQVPQDTIGGNAFVNAHDWPNQAFNGCPLAFADEPAHEVLRVDDADDVVDRAAVDGQPGIRALGDDADHLVERGGDVYRRYTRARNHQLLRLAQVQPQRALQPLVLIRLEQATIP